MSDAAAGSRSLRAGAVLVSVPATSANLGPGFDSFGVALDLRDELEVEALPGLAGTVEVHVVGEGADDVPRDGSHLVVRTIRAAWDALGVPQPGLVLRCHNRIPHARGLGSSAAAIVAGTAAAFALLDDGAPQPNVDPAEVFGFAAAAEGHPDNVAACVYGGFTVAWTDGSGTPRALALPVPLGCRPYVMVPPDGVATSRVRALLPGQVPHADAARTAGRAGLLVAALLTGRAEVLLAATEDWLHQDYRAEAMPDTWAVVRALRDAGVAAVVSGAGPTVLALVGDEVVGGADSAGGADSGIGADSVVGDRRVAGVSVPSTWWLPPVSFSDRGVSVSAGT